MEVAYSLIEQAPISIHVFCQKPEAEIEKLRRALLCPECKGKAWFRKKSKDGKAACFNAYHEDGCDVAAGKGQTKNLPEVVEEIQQIITNNESIDLDFVAPNAAHGDGGRNNKNTTGTRQGGYTGSSHSISPAIERNQSRRLSSILKLLTGSEDFAKSDIQIHVGPPAKHPYYARNLFVNFDDMTEEHIGMLRGFWGVISDANEDITWLNISNSVNVSIPISAIRDTVVNGFKVNNAEDLAGAYVLVFGYLNVSKTKAKKYFIKVRDDNPAHIYIRLNKG